MLRETDYLLGPPRVSPTILSGVINRLDGPDAKDQQFLQQLVYWCRVAGVDDGDAVTQFLHETGNATAPRWNEDTNDDGAIDLNPGGIGIPSNSTVQPFKIANVDEAARIFVNCIYAMVKKQAHPDVPIPANAQDWFTRVWLAKVNHPNFPTVRRVADLNIRYTANNDQHATWAWDDQYPAKLVSRAKQFMPGLPDQSRITLPTEPQPEEPTMSLTFGKVPHPLYQNRPIWKPEGVGQNNLGKRSVKGVSWHRVWGSLWGTDTHFRQPTVGALTDYGVGVKAQDGAANAGLILRWNDPLGFQSGWASGTYSAAHAYGDGAAFVNKYGVNAINRDRASIEISGYENTPLDDAARDAIAGLTAYWADQYGIPWDVFPIAPQDGFSFVAWHEEFGPDKGTKKCPFQVVKEETPALIERTRAILKRYQTGTYEQPQTPDGTVYAAPITYDWLAPEEAAKGLDRMIGRTRVFYVPQVYEAIRETPRKQATGKNDKLIGPPIEAGLRFRADFCYRSAGVSYVLTPYGTRVKAADLLPKIQISARGTVSIRRTADQATGEVIRKADQ